MNHLSNVDAAWIAFAMLFPVVLYLLFSAYQARQRASTYKAVMDRISSAEDFAAFLQSTAGQKFITDLSGSESPVRAVIGAIQKGMILVSWAGEFGGPARSWNRMRKWQTSASYYFVSALVF